MWPYSTGHAYRKKCLSTEETRTMQISTSIYFYICSWVAKEGKELFVENLKHTFAISSSPFFGGDVTGTTTGLSFSPGAMHKSNPHNSFYASSW
jgi:hypothetical protein